MTSTCICFDLDDTLYPYEEFARLGLRASADTLERITGRHLHNELADLYFEEGVTSHIFERLIGRYDAIPDSVTTQLTRANYGADGDLEPYPDTEQVLASLRGDHSLAVVTDARKTSSKLERLDLMPYFDRVCSTAGKDVSKRDREPFTDLLSELSVHPKNAVYVGDDPRMDFVVPNRLGMGTVRVRRGRFTHLNATNEVATPDVEIDRLRELPSLGDTNQL